MATRTRGLSCRSCAAALRRCWVCGEAVRCVGCQQCLRCEGLLDDLAAGTGRAAVPPVSIPTVRLKRPKADARPRPTPPPAPPTGRPRAKRIVPPRPSAHLPSLPQFDSAVWHVRAPSNSDGPRPASTPQFGSAVWYVRVAVVPALMLLAAYWSYAYFRNWSGLGLASACVVGFYLPYVVLTPVRRSGEFFPLGDEGPGLPIVMVIGGALIGGVCGIVLGLFCGERVGVWGGAAVAAVAFHGLYYATVVEKSRAAK